jgi:predicted TIM-barrel fold metal-dependent hydrolase
MRTRFASSTHSRTRRSFCFTPACSWTARRKDGQRGGRGSSDSRLGPNVYVKLSGLGTFVRSCTQNEWQPLIEQTVDVFGPDRCMFGSNFPIEKLWTTYSELVRVFLASVAQYTSAEQHRILCGVAADVYKI